jgi:uncharacterized membrane protein
METTEIINGLAEKIGVAADKLIPVAERLVTETQNKYLVLSIGTGVGVIVCLLITTLLIAWTHRLCLRNKEGLSENIASLCATIVTTIVTTIVATVVCAAMTVENISNYMSPAKTLLESIIK